MRNPAMLVSKICSLQLRVCLFVIASGSDTIFKNEMLLHAELEIFKLFFSASFVIYILFNRVQGYVPLLKAHISIYKHIHILKRSFIFRQNMLLLKSFAKI